MGPELQIQQNEPLVYCTRRVMQSGYTFWIRVMVMFCWHFLFSHKQMPPLKMSWSSLLTEFFYPNHKHVRCFHPASGEACHLPNFGFIHLALHPPCCIPWFSLLYIYVAHKILISLRDLSCDNLGQDILGGYGCMKKSILLCANYLY